MHLTKALVDRWTHRLLSGELGRRALDLRLKGVKRGLLFLTNSLCLLALMCSIHRFAMQTLSSIVLVLNRTLGPRTPDIDLRLEGALVILLQFRASLLLPLFPHIVFVLG
jgi:hypothetical protein